MADTKRTHQSVHARSSLYTLPSTVPEKQGTFVLHCAVVCTVIDPLGIMKEILGRTLGMP